MCTRNYSVGPLPITSLKTNRNEGSGKLAGVEVYTAPGMQAHFQLAIDWHSDAL